LAKVCVVLPTYNEGETIEEVINRIESLRLDACIVIVDDGSTDGTQEIIEILRRQYNNITLVERGFKLGLGTAIKCGMKTALCLQPPVEHIVTMDCDLSHDPNDIPRLIGLAKMSNADIVVGCRYTEKGGIIGWNLYRKLVSRSANLMVRLLLNLPVYDSTTGFKVYTRHAVEAILPNLHTGAYEIQIETLYHARKLGLRITEAPIIFRQRSKGKSKLGKAEIKHFLIYVLKTWLSFEISQEGILSYHLRQQRHDNNKQSERIP
jgi:dolichol-phosphate mannosyltransferase